MFIFSLVARLTFQKVASVGLRIGTIKLLFTVDGDGIIQTLRLVALAICGRDARDFMQNKASRKLGGRGDASGNGNYITALSLLIAVACHRCFTRGTVTRAAFIRIPFRIL